MTFKEFLLSPDDSFGRACSEAIKWLGNRTPEQALTDCQRGDWLMWWAAKAGVDRRKLVCCAGHCANTVRHLMKDERSINAVDASIGYGEGTVTDEELRVAATAAADYGVDYAATAAALAATAAAVATTIATTKAADNKEANQRQTADIVREILGQEILERTKMYLNESN